jgi:CubicO group peptidase (beta-lactamase class C family)
MHARGGNVFTVSAQEHSLSEGYVVTHGRRDEKSRYLRAAGHSLFAAFLMSSSAAAQTPAERLDALAREYFESGRLYGGLLVADSDVVVYEAAFGLANKEEEVPNRHDTLYPVHSITKSFNAILILQLVEDGIIELDGTLTEYLTSLPSADWGAVTIHQLLSHRSGIPDYFLSSTPIYPDCDDRTLSRQALLTSVASLPLEFPPGTGFSYSNTGYALLGQIIEVVTDTPYDDVLRERILDPLGMTATRWVASLEDPRIARQYLSDGDGVAPLEVVHAGQSGIVTTLDDMLRFVRALGSPDLLTPDTWQLAFTPHSLPNEARRPIPPHLFPHGYGFGLAAAPGEPELAVLHGGSGCGGTALYYRLIDSGRIVILWSNRGDVQPDVSLVAELLASLR